MIYETRLARNDTTISSEQLKAGIYMGHLQPTAVDTTGYEWLTNNVSNDRWLKLPRTAAIVDMQQLRANNFTHLYFGLASNSFLKYVYI